MVIHSTFVLYISLLVCACVGEETGQCNKDDLSCSEGSVVFDEAKYNAYEKNDITSRKDFLIHERLDEIDRLKAEDPESALQKVLKVLDEYPESPRALHSLIRTYRVLYNRLSEENRRIGRIEYLEKMIDVVVRFSELDRSEVPVKLWTGTLDYGLANTVAMGERTHTRNTLKNMFNKLDGLEEEDKMYYIQSYLDELFFVGDFTQVKEIIMEHTTDQMPSIEFRFLMGILERYKESQKNEPFPVFNEAMIEQTMPSSQEEKDDLFVYCDSLVKELRKQEKIELVDIIYDLMVDLGLYPSRYQRILHKVDKLEAKPVWQLDDTGYTDKFDELVANWETIRDEAMELVRLTPEQNITYGFDPLTDDKGNYKMYVYHGLGHESFEDSLCSITPTICKMFKDYPVSTLCPLGSISLDYILPDTHIHPHNSNSNFRLRAQLPLITPGANLTEISQAGLKLNGGKYNITWEQGKIILFDDSFEHEIFNESEHPRLILSFDLLHPDMTEKMYMEVKEFADNMVAQMAAAEAQAAKP